MKHLLCLLGVGIIILSCKNDAKIESTDKNSRPNIVLLIGDDQGYPYFGFMGADYVYTPNMDKLAKSGTVFTQGYVPDNHCRPSLQTLMTSTLPTDHNKQVEEMLTNELAKMKFENDLARKTYEKEYRHHAMKHFRTLPKILSDLGYKSFQGGKMVGIQLPERGF